MCNRKLLWIHHYEKWLRHSTENQNFQILWQHHIIRLRCEVFSLNLCWCLIFALQSFLVSFQNFYLFISIYSSKPLKCIVIVDIYATKWWNWLLRAWNFFIRVEDEVNNHTRIGISISISKICTPHKSKLSSIWMNNLQYST